MTGLAWPLATAPVTRLERLVSRHDVEVAGRRVVWRQLGKGQPLVLLHGGHGTWLHWVRNVEFLARHHAVWIPDMPGYGESDAPVETRLDDLVEGVWRSLDALVGVDTPVHLVGFSFGALVATELASRRPAVRRLVLLGPAGHGGTRRPRGALHAWQDQVAGSPEWLDTMRHNLLMHMLHDECSIDDVALQVHGQACLATRFHSREISRAAGLRQALDAYAGPVLMVWGAHDVTADPATAGAQLTSGHPQREIAVIEQAGHWVQYEQADRINALLHGWMNSPQREPVNPTVQAVAPG